MVNITGVDLGAILPRKHEIFACKQLKTQQMWTFLWKQKLEVTRSCVEVYLGTHKTLNALKLAISSLLLDVTPN